MKSETRFIIYTNDAILLAIARFPLTIVKWDTLSQSQKSIFVVADQVEYVITSKIINIIKSRETEKVLQIDEKLFTMPPGFTPKIGKLFSIGDEGRFLEFKRYTLHPNFTLDPSHLEVITAIEKTWNNGLFYIDDLVKEIPKAKAFVPKYRRKSFLQLEKVDDSVDKAQDVEILWDIRDQIILGGNIYAKTPICGLVERTQVSLRQWEYRPYIKYENQEMSD